jgi:hypothetical protein
VLRTDKHRRRSVEHAVRRYRCLKHDQTHTHTRAPATHPLIEMQQLRRHPVTGVKEEIVDWVGEPGAIWVDAQRSRPLRHLARGQRRQLAPVAPEGRLGAALARRIQVGVVAPLRLSRVCVCLPRWVRRAVCSKVAAACLTAAVARQTRTSSPCTGGSHATRRLAPWCALSRPAEHRQRPSA